VAWHICAAGTVTLDDVSTPHERRAEQPGGSAIYFALAAAVHATVHLVGAVGADGEAKVRALLAGRDIDLEGLEVGAGPTFRWRATHDFELWQTACEESHPGVYATWSPSLPPAAGAADVVFLGSMAPRQQLAVLRQSTARLRAGDTMTGHIRSERTAVAELVHAVDVLFLNRGELSALTGAPEGDWAEAARGLLGRGRLRLVVVKAGPLGAAAVTRDAIVERSAHPVEVVLDPTGAGDALAGGFLGACAAAESDPVDYLEPALAAGLRQAAAAISDFGPTGLQDAVAGAPQTADTSWQAFSDGDGRPRSSWS
jgi:sugar/nucleoside kinase (ribokinase family)